jgi:hypothetical protein
MLRTLGMFQDWWKYEWTRIKRAIKETSWTKFLGWSVASACLGLIGQWKMDVQSEHDTIIKIGVAIACGLIGALGAVVLKLMFLPAKMATEQQAELARLAKSHDLELQVLKENHNKEIRSRDEEIKTIKAQIEPFGIRANATFTPPSSLSVEAVNIGNQRIIIKSMEAIFEDGDTQIKPPHFTQKNGNNVLTHFELDKKGDIQYLEGIGIMFSPIPNELVLIDTLGNRYPVEDWREACDGLRNWPNRIKEILRETAEKYKTDMKPQG